MNLYDEIILNTEENITEEGEKVIISRTERRWLGSLRIPFSTLYLNGKIEGTFSLCTPPLLLGYEYDTKGWLLTAQTDTHNGSAASKRTYLTLFVTIDPSLQLPEPLTLKVNFYLYLQCIQIAVFNFLLQCDTTETESVTQFCKRHNHFPIL